MASFSSLISLVQSPRHPRRCSIVIFSVPNTRLSITLPPSPSLQFPTFAFPSLQFPTFAPTFAPSFQIHPSRSRSLHFPSSATTFLVRKNIQRVHCTTTLNARRNRKIAIYNGARFLLAVKAQLPHYQKFAVYFRHRWPANSPSPCSPCG